MNVASKQKLEALEKCYARLRELDLPCKLPPPRKPAHYWKRAKRLGPLPIEPER